MYKFSDEKTEKICKKFNLTECLILFENDDINKLKKGLTELARHTCNILQEMYELDDFGTLLLSESIRFLIYSFKYQKYYDYNFEHYYKKILKKFHELGYLLFKKDIQPYKMYKYKKYAFKINHKLGDEKVELVYYSLKNMRIDFGRYRVDKLTQMFPKHTSLDYNFIEQLS